MIVSIMQPYFFPYIGYFQLMAACDTFVMFDDAQYIRRGWVNRNRILIGAAAQWVTLPVAYADHRLPINQRNYILDNGAQSDRLLRRIAGAYRAAPYFQETMVVIESVMAFTDSNVAAFNINLLTCLSKHIGIHTPIRIGSAIEKSPGLQGQEIVIEICERLGATGYINPIGGLSLYDDRLFSSRSLQLRFLKSRIPLYPQFGYDFISSLSIIDVLMFNGSEKTREMLVQFDLVSSTVRSDASATISGQW